MEQTNKFDVPNEIDDRDREFFIGEKVFTFLNNLKTESPDMVSDIFLKKFDTEKLIEIMNSVELRNEKINEALDQVKFMEAKNLNIKTEFELNSQNKIIYYEDEYVNRRSRKGLIHPQRHKDSLGIAFTENYSKYSSSSGLEFAFNKNEHLLEHFSSSIFLFNDTVCLYVSDSSKIFIFKFNKLNETIDQNEVSQAFFTKIVDLEKLDEESILIYGYNINGTLCVCLVRVKINDEMFYVKKVLNFEDAFLTRFKHIINLNKNATDFKILFKKEKGLFYLVQKFADQSTKNIKWNFSLSEYQIIDSVFLKKNFDINLNERGLIEDCCSGKINLIGHHDMIICSHGNTVFIIKKNFKTDELILKINGFKFDQENDRICDLKVFNEFLLVFFSNQSVYLLNNEFKLVCNGKLDFKDLNLEKTFIPIEFKELRHSNYDIKNLKIMKFGIYCCFKDVFTNQLIFDVKPSWSFKQIEIEIYDNSVHDLIDEFYEKDSLKHDLAETFYEVNKLEKIGEKEAKFSDEFFSKIENADKNSDKEVLFIGIKKNLSCFGTECILSESNSDDPIVNKHSKILFSGLLESNPFVYSIELKIKGLNFVDIKRSRSSLENFTRDFKKLLGDLANIPQQEIVILDIHNKNVNVNYTFSTPGFHDNFQFNNLNNKKKSANFSEYDILSSERFPLLEECKISVNMLNPKFDREYNYDFKDTRGTLPYYPPVGWKRFGINIEFFGFKNSDDWIQMDRNPNEWAVAYHGLRTDPKNTLDKIINDSSGKPTLKPGKAQAYKSSININKLDKQGFNKMCGEGVYCSPKIEEAEKYTQVISFNKGENKAIIGLMCRVNPSLLKIPQTRPDYYIVTQSDNIRPYAFLLKKK